jgi:hypothetical protein
VSVSLLAAAALAVVTAGAHSWLGERYLLIRLFRRPDLPRLFGDDRFTRRTLRFAWHVTSVAWLGFAALLVALAGEAVPDRATLLRVVAATFALHAAVAAIGSRGRHLSWVVFVAIAALAWSAA